MKYFKLLPPKKTNQHKNNFIKLPKAMLRLNNRAIVIVLVAVIGTGALLLTKAATYSVSVEPESGALSNGATKISGDSTASGQSYVKFGGTSTPPGSTLDNFFIIGAFQQADYLFGQWKGRGINTMVEPNGGNPSPGSWADSANNLGLKVIAPFSAGSKSNVIAWHHQDEPDGIYSQVPYSQIQSDYQLWKKTNPNMPAFINFIGRLNQYDIQTNESGEAWYKKYIAGADWTALDIYPINEGYPTIDTLGYYIDILRNWSGGKPVIAYIESNDMQLNDSNPGPTPAQLRAEIWSAIVHGVRGYIFFSHHFNGWAWAGFDNTTPEVAAEMTTQNNKVASLTPVLQGAINPSNIKATFSSPLEAGWRDHSSGKYFFVVNTAGNQLNNQQISFTGIGSATSAEVYQEGRTVQITNSKLVDNFEPFGVHIYKIK